MSAQNYSRPASAERYRFLGVKTNSAPDAMPAHKSPYAQNVRGYNDSSTTSRPQTAKITTTSGSPGPVLALEPTLGVYKIGSSLYYNGASIDGGYSANLPCSLAPFRPNQSVQAWEYIWDGVKNTRFLAGTGVQNTGIAEPQFPPDGYRVPITYGGFSGLNLIDPSQTWGVAGTASDFIINNGPIDWRTDDIIESVWSDPVSGGAPYTIQTTGEQTYSREQLIVTAGTTFARIEDVFQPIPNNISIAGIYYYSGTTGKCVIVPNLQEPGVGVNDTSLFAEQVISNLRRGALVKVNSEVCYVYDVESGPDGTICFTTVTTGAYDNTATLSGVPALQAFLSAPTQGNPFYSSSWFFTVGSGTGSISIPSYTPNFFSFGGASFQPDDYVHLSVNIDDLANLTELKLVFNVANGNDAFNQDAYYYSIRPSDIAAAVDNTLTQIGAAQIYAQRQLITEEAGVGEGYGADAQTSPGSSVWSEIIIPLSAFNRIGNDQTRTLNDTHGVQILVNCTGTVHVGISSVTIHGGGQLEVGSGPPIYYCYRFRNSKTGAKSNRSPISRYGLSPMREGIVLVNNNSLTIADPQADTVDWFRTGGSIEAAEGSSPLDEENFRYIGSQQLSISYGQWVDNYPDDAVRLNDPLETDNYQPFPSIDAPLTVTGISVCGTAVVVTVSPVGNILRLLPGNLITIGQQVYTLYTRPTQIGTNTYLFQLVENAGASASGSSPIHPIKLTGIWGLSGAFSASASSVTPKFQCVYGLAGAFSASPNIPLSPTTSLVIYEPAIANQPMPYVWGPDPRGVFFGVGDPLRPGTIVFTNPQNPDSASDEYTYEVCPPSEPLQGGELLVGTSFAASAKRWWQGYPQQSVDKPYSFQECPVGKGLAAPFGHCTDGKYVYFVAKDGIERHSGGPSESLTDDDLYNLFPHEGVFPSDYGYGGFTFYAPDYTYAANFQLNWINNFLYFDYLDSTKTWRSMVMDTRTLAWVPDVYAQPMAIHAGTTLPASNDQQPSTAVRNRVVFMGATTGDIYKELESPDPAQEAVSWVLATHEETAGDLRAQKQWGDLSLDALAAGGNITTRTLSFGVYNGEVGSIIGGQSTRPQQPYVVPLNSLLRSIGVLLYGTDQGAATVLYSWQPSYLTEPEWTTLRFSDWDDAGSPGFKFWQGFILEADTADIQKRLIMQDSDALMSHDFDSATGTNLIQHDGQQKKAYTFIHPFLAHMVRIEPDDDSTAGVEMRTWGITWVTQPAPEFVLQWITQNTGHGIDGYKHVPRLFLPYNAPAGLTLTVTVDGTPLTPLAIPPSTGYAKLVVPLPPNKGLLYQYSAVSTQPFELWAEDIELFIKGWGSSGPYLRMKNIGGSLGDQARI